MFNASDIMTTPVISVNPSNTLRETVEVLAEKKISGLPVVDTENKMVGMITEKDIVEYANKLHVIRLIHSSAWMSPYEDISFVTSYKKGFELLSKTKVQEVMSKKVVSVKENTSGEEIAKLMKKKNVNRIPVINDAGELIGIISRADLIHYLATQETFPSYS